MRLLLILLPLLFGVALSQEPKDGYFCWSATGTSGTTILQGTLFAKIENGSISTIGLSYNTHAFVINGADYLKDIKAAGLRFVGDDRIDLSTFDPRYLRYIGVTADDLVEDLVGESRVK